jgi:hypothetical protein
MCGSAPQSLVRAAPFNVINPIVLAQEAVMELTFADRAVRFRRALWPQDEDFCQYNQQRTSS